MKILLVDDETRKLRKLSATINELQSAYSIIVDWVLDLKTAKEKMRMTSYDLVVMDLRISEHLGQEESISEIGGLYCIDEILETDSIKTPLEIVLLTEYDDLYQISQENEKYKGFHLLKYDELSIEWEEIIKGKIIYRIKFEESRERFSDNKKMDFAIICAVDNEMNEVRKVFKDCEFNCISFPGDSTNYYYGTVGTHSGKKNIIFAQQREMGMTNAATLTEKVIYHFEPKYVIMVGIAAGIGEQKKPGDILVATEVWNYSSGKYIINTDGNTVFMPDPQNISLDPRIDSILRKDFSAVLYEIKRGWQGVSTTWEIKTVLGPLACGAAVVGSPDIVDDMIKKHSRKTIGLDMESYGMFFACRYGHKSETIPICLKAISDFADDKKTDSYQNYAAYISASFALYLIRSELD